MIINWDEIDNKLTILYREGKTSKEIAEILNMSINTIKKRKRQLGLYGDKFIKWTFDMDNELKRLCSLNKPDKEISALLNLPKTVISSRKRILNLRMISRIKFWTIDKDNQLISFFNNGESAQNISRKMKISISSINNRKCKLGLKKRNGFLNKIKWTPENIDKLKNYYNNGYDNEFIAKKMGASINSIVFRKYKEGLYDKRRLFWTEEKIVKLKHLCEIGERLSKIAQEFGICLSKVIAAQRKYNIRCVDRKYTEQDRKFIEENYPKYGIKFCAEKLNKPYEAVSAFIYRHSSKRLDREQRRKIYTEAFERYHNNIPYKIGHQQFMNITTPEIAYFLGYFWADGHIKRAKNKNDSNIYNFNMTIQKRDYLSIKWILDKIGDWTICFSKSKNPNWQDKAAITTSNKFFFEFLIENDYSIKSQTTPTKILNRIPDHLKHYFWLGFFDGDGCFYICKDHFYGQFCFAGSYMQDWKDLQNLLNNLNIKYSVCRRAFKKGKSSAISFCKQQDCIIFGNYLYSDKKINNIGLNRKYNKWIYFKEKYLHKIKIKNFIPDQLEIISNPEQLFNIIKKYEGLINRENLTKKFAISGYFIDKWVKDLVQSNKIIKKSDFGIYSIIK